MNAFRGPNGVRAGWRLLAFLLVMNLPLTGVQWFVIKVLRVEHIDFRHFTWNWSSMGVFGSPNTGNAGLPLPGHLLAGTFHGSPSLTGGGMGAEASLWMFALLPLLFWLFHRRHPEARFPDLSRDAS